MNIIQFSEFWLLKQNSNYLLIFIAIIYYAINQLFTYYYIKNHFIDYSTGPVRVQRTAHNNNAKFENSYCIIRYLHSLYKALVIMFKCKNHLYPLFRH